PDAPGATELLSFWAAACAPMQTTKMLASSKCPLRMSALLPLITNVVVVSAVRVVARHGFIFVVGDDGFVSLAGLPRIQNVNEPLSVGVGAVPNGDHGVGASA